MFKFLRNLFSKSTPALEAGEIEIVSDSVLKICDNIHEFDIVRTDTIAAFYVNRNHPHIGVIAQMTYPQFAVPTLNNMRVEVTPYESMKLFMALFENERIVNETFPSGYVKDFEKAVEAAYN